MYNEFNDLNNKTPKEAAEIVGKVEKDNYLAHSIRQIELAILKTQSKRYHIFTFSSNFEVSKIYFFERYCVIRLQDGHENMDDKKARLILAHELGHFVYNICRLEDHDKLNKEKRSDAEEQYSWAFAFHLISMKSEEHRNNSWQQKYVYDERDLKNMFSAILKEKAQPEVYDSLVESLGLIKFKA